MDYRKKWVPSYSNLSLLEDLGKPPGFPPQFYDTHTPHRPPILFILLLLENLGLAQPIQFAPREIKPPRPLDSPRSLHRSSVRPNETEGGQQPEQPHPGDAGHSACRNGVARGVLELAFSGLFKGGLKLGSGFLVLTGLKLGSFFLEGGLEVWTPPMVAHFFDTARVDIGIGDPPPSQRRAAPGNSCYWLPPFFLTRKQLAVRRSKSGGLFAVGFCLVACSIARRPRSHVPGRFRGVFSQKSEWSQMRPPPPPASPRISPPNLEFQNTKETSYIFRCALKVCSWHPTLPFCVPAKKDPHGLRHTHGVHSLNGSLVAKGGLTAFAGMFVPL